MNSFRVGYAQAVITPSLAKPVYLAGFGQNRLAESVHDDLYVRTLVISDGETRAALVTLDLLGLARHHCLEIEARVQRLVGDLQVITVCTHVHHAPDVIGLWGKDESTSGIDEAYLETVKAAIEASVLKAIADMQPTDMKIAAVNVPKVAKNARNPMILDEELSCIQFVRDGKAVVNWLVFPCHPEVLWEHNPHITSDYAATLRTQMEAATGAATVFMVGALGGMMTPDVIDHSFDEAEAMGKALADAGLKALSMAEPAKVGEIFLQREVFTIPMVSPLLEMAVAGGLLPEMRNERGELTTEAGLMVMGGCWVVSVPGELLPAAGLAVKDKLRKAGAVMPVIIGLANDEIGYILPDEVYVYPENPFEPGAHYEETMSVGPEACSRLMKAIDVLIDTYLDQPH
ncbi:MAG: neutral/alkaline non-lysosomal ceramidase N-terminal domain-containing protein [Anaerolineae bacterium]|nr:neutral/alkaline non-lysosomal ceramidase N-terminal domain-containing protein [Anaerolineae bacterium]